MTETLTRPVEGLVIRTESGFHRVLIDDQIIVSRAPKRLLQGERTNTTAVVIGDHVRLQVQRDGTGSIQEILPRANELVRGSAGGRYFLDVIAANLDLMVVVYSIKDPEFNGAGLDRYLVMSESAGVPALVCLNKLDKSDRREADAIAAPYRAAGYPVIVTCAKTGTGVDQLRAAITRKLSALVGPSGVGKSTLLNQIQPGLRLRTGEVSEATNKGRHTTTTAELLPLTDGGWVADTPGLRELAIREVDQEDVAWLFPEFRPYMAKCRYRNCTHQQENDCAVRAALEGGQIHTSRYRSYLRVFEEIREERSF